jgi:hypothetical protein
MDVDEVRGELESLGHDGFVQRYGKLFLVLTDPDSLESFAGFVNTASREAHEITARRTKLADVDIRPLVSRRRGDARVIIGREDADISLPHKKVSKVHAYFTVDGGLPSVEDAGSKNGTWINGRMLSPNRPVPVDVGDEMAFGSVAATLWSLDDLLAAVDE